MVRPAAAVFGAVAALGTVATAATFALQGSASQGRWVEGANELVFALVGLAVLARGSADARSIAGGALGLLALSVGLSKTPVFLQRVVLSAFPATLTRVLVALTIRRAPPPRPLDWLLSSSCSSRRKNRRVHAVSCGDGRSKLRRSCECLSPERVG